MANIKKRNRIGRSERRFSNYDTSRIEPELGISLDELNRRQREDKWEVIDFKKLDELKRRK